MIGVQPPDPEKSMEEQQKSLLTSLKTIESGVNRQGCQLLVPTRVDTTDRAFTNTSYTLIPSYSFAINASGGVITIAASFTVLVNANSCYISLDIDENKVCEKFLNGADQVIGCLVFFYQKSLSGGAHSISFKVKVSGGTATLNYNNVSSEVTINEVSVP